MVELFDLIRDEEEAIASYSSFLKTHELNKSQRASILKILKDEVKHKKRLLNMRKYIYS
jgi:rubrerythrin